jgi:L-seryl-tRNA(Ser) seleniumtransferase
MTQILRLIPPVDQILKRPGFKKLVEEYSRTLVLAELQSALEGLRAEIRGPGITQEELSQSLENLPAAVHSILAKRFSPTLRRLINATGVLIHTNAGRAPLASSIAEQMKVLAAGYSNLEYNLEARKRGHRDAHFESRLVRLLGCEAATVCNNNAAAVFLILNTLAENRTVLVSRGELVEIGGSFRIPAIMRKSRAVLREVGTTNKTRISDYREAADDETGLILRVHPSNYKIVGFTHRPSLPELVDLSKELGIPLVKDAGSGYLFDAQFPALAREPVIKPLLDLGVDLVCFSGDKLLGGPQAGIIAGRRDLVERIRKNPLMRVLRVDKVTYKGLDETLIAYEKGRQNELIPIYRMLSLSLEELQARVESLIEQLGDTPLGCSLRDGHSVIGGGSAPQEQVPTILLQVRSAVHSPDHLERTLRNGPVPILGRIEDDCFLLDLRTVHPSEDHLIVAALQEFRQASTT